MESELIHELKGRALYVIAGFKSKPYDFESIKQHLNEINEIVEKLEELEDVEGFLELEED